MKKTLLALSMAALTLPVASQAADSGIEISGNFGLTSDYKFRGITQTDGKPAAQGGFDLVHSSGLYVGTWTSNVSYWANTGGNGQEIDVYGGYSSELPLGLGLDIGALKYYYPGNQPAVSQNTTEFYLGLSYGPVSYKYSQTDGLWFGFSDSKSSVYQSLAVELPVSEAISFSAAYGQQKVKGTSNPTYNDYSVGMSYALPSDFSVTLAYVGTSGLSAAEKAVFTAGPNGTTKLYDAKAILTVSKSF
jgi:uncharacterized protein (TIGR02001 family)